MKTPKQTTGRRARAHGSAPLKITRPVSPEELKALVDAHVADNGPLCPPGSDGCVCMQVIGINGGFAIFTCQDGECVPP